MTASTSPTLRGDERRPPDPVLRPGQAGTGNYDTFLRIQNNGTEQGFNTDGAVQFDTKASLHTHSLLLSALATVKVNGIDYYEIRLDINEAKGPPASP